MGNIGDDWISKSAKEFLKNCGVQVNCITEPNANDLKAEFGDLKWVRFRWNIREILALRRNLSDFDAMIFTGGGWFAGDRNLRNTLMWFLRITLCPIPIYTFGFGVGPFVNRRQTILFKQIAKRIRNFSVRHKSDAKHLPYIGVVDFTVSNDLSYLEPLESEIDQRTKRELCLVVLPGWSKHRSQEALGELGSKIKKDLLREGIPEASIWFVSFQLRPFDDYLYWREIFPNRKIIGDISDAQSLFRSAKYVVAGRLHAGFAAARFGVPEIAVIPYHNKFDNLADLGMHVPKEQERFLEFRSSNPISYQDRHHSTKDCFLLLINQISMDLVRKNNLEN